MTSAPTRVVLWGANGRMGRAIRNASASDPTVDVVACVGRGAPPEPGGDVVVVDFSSPEGFDRALAWSRANGAPFVSGTTGLSESQLAALDAAATDIPVLLAPNTSLGVAVTRALVRAAAAALPTSFEPEIVEVHHHRKVDAPSGTAVALAEAIETARDVKRVHGREGAVGARQTDELGVHALRGGDVVGEHTVYFFGQGERVEITHRATDRAIFARGAMAAARWIATRAPGSYTMDDVLGLSASER